MSRFERFFNQIAQDLDLTDTENKVIINSYEAVANCLVNCKELKMYLPNVFPQGSFRLGTVVKPLSKDDYDIDLVCELNYSNLSARELKHTVGEALKNSRYKYQLEKEHGRCWTLDYNSNPPYHIDILPGISLPNGRVKATKMLNNNYFWLYTNPKGFADWFLSLDKKIINKKSNYNVEPIIEYSGKSVIQRAVQLIKRHRDVYFKDNPEKGPASVIITALTGLSYNNESTIEEILKHGPIQWISQIEIKDSKLSIKIPSLPDDDYADKWNEEGEEPVKNFLRWHHKLIEDLDNLFKECNYYNFIKISKKMFTESSIDKVINKNPKIMELLNKSFKSDYSSEVISCNHPLFKHAQSFPKGVGYLPTSTLKVRILCRVYNNEIDANQFSDRFEDEFEEFSPILKKGKHLAFKAIIHTFDYEEYYVKWQVTNTGKEAMHTENGPQLRGEFIAEERCTLKEYVHTEITSYSGTHFVQFFIFRKKIINGKYKENCILKSNIITINIGVKK